MYISCSSCSTSYTIDGDYINGNGCKVRCYKCGHTWQHIPDSTEPVLDLKPVLNPLRQPVSSEPPSPLHSNPHYSGHRYSPQASVSLSYTKPSAEIASTLLKAGQKVAPTSKTSLSQCVFCRRSPRCNLHDLYSGRLH